MKIEDMDFNMKEAKGILEKLPKNTFKYLDKAECRLSGGEHDRSGNPEMLEIYIREGMTEIWAPEGASNFYVNFSYVPRFMKFNYKDTTFVFHDYNENDVKMAMERREAQWDLRDKNRGANINSSES